jgi:hypothetical protein
LLDILVTLRTYRKRQSKYRNDFSRARARARVR